MASRVNVIIQGSYAMPPVCVSCGAPAGTGTISGGGTDWTGKHSVYLKFPICDACDEAQRATRSPRRKGHWLGGLIGFAVGALIGSLGSFAVESGAWAFVAIGVTVLGIVLGPRFFLRSVPEEMKARADALPGAVTFKKYRVKTFGASSATIEFASSAFAALFCAANPIVAVLVDGGSVPVEETVEDVQDPPSGWYPDPSGRHERRWWSGSSWTENVDDGGTPSVDEPV